MLTSNLSNAEIEVLNYERFHYPCPMVQKRLHAVYLKNTIGGSDTAIGLICDLHFNSVSTWVKTYNSEGIKPLFVNNYGTNKSDLQAHSISILENFEQSAPVSSNEAVSRIKELTGISRCPTQVRNWMHQNGLSFRKMGHLPAKVDVEKQEKWLKDELTPVIEKAKKGLVNLFFMDAAHFVLNPYLCAVWCAVRLFIKAPAGRQRLNVVGAVNAISKQIITLCNDSYVNAEVITDFLIKLKKEAGNLPIVIVLDNARYQHCKYVLQVAEGLGITLLFLPPYSPNLNLIERLWKMTKKKCLYAKYYENFQAFSGAITNCLNSFSQKELDSCLTLKFQSFKNSQFYPV
jgi:transposase